MNMSTLSYQSIVNGMDESAIANAPSLLLLPAHNAENCEDDDEQTSYENNCKKISQAKQQHQSNKPKNSTIASNFTADSTQSAQTIQALDMLEGNPKHLNPNNSLLATETSLLAINDENHHDDSSVMPSNNTAPITKIILVKTYRPVKVGAALLVLISLIFLVIAAITSEWLSRYDLPDAPKGTTFYRYGFFEFCYGYINRKTGETVNVTCQLWPIIQKTWVQVCAGLYAGAMLIGIGAFFVLFAAFKSNTDNLPKWRLYKVSIGLLFAAAFFLSTCLLLWSARFLFEVSIFHRQRLYISPTTENPYHWLASSNRNPTTLRSSVNPTHTTKFNPISFPSRKTTPSVQSAKKSTPSTYQFNSYNAVAKNVTITGEMTREVHAQIWPQVMATVICGWGYILAWVAVVLFILPAVLLMIDGKKDEHVCEEQLVYPSP